MVEVERDFRRVMRGPLVRGWVCKVGVQNLNLNRLIHHVRVKRRNVYVEEELKDHGEIEEFYMET